MKLKTKFQDEDFELGEVTDVDITTMPDGCFKANAKAMRGGLHTFYYDTKAAFDADWEDAPEDTKDFWYIRCGGVVKQNEDSSLEEHHIDKHKEIGNYFSSREDAEKAVEKLKAWKRLKDKEVKLKIVTIGHKKYLEPTAEDDKTFDEVKELIKDFELIFGGEE